MSISKFSDLQVWQKSYEATLKIYKITQNYPSTEQYGLVAQIRRSANSVCANIAEGKKKSDKDFRRFLKIAEGSLEETKHHLMLSKDLTYINQKQFEDLFNKLNEIGRMLSSLSKKVSF